MPKRAISVTLDVDNHVWLRAQAGGGSNVSRILNELVSDARAEGRRFGAASRSVAGTVDLRHFDPAAAAREIRALFGGAHRARPPAAGMSAASARSLRAAARRGTARLR